MLLIKTLDFQTDTSVPTYATLDMKQLIPFRRTAVFICLLGPAGEVILVLEGHNLSSKICYNLDKTVSQWWVIQLVI